MKKIYLLFIIFILINSMLFSKGFIFTVGKGSLTVSDISEIESELIATVFSITDAQDIYHFSLELPYSKNIGFYFYYDLGMNEDITSLGYYDDLKQTIFSNTFGSGLMIYPVGRQMFFIPFISADVAYDSFNATSTQVMYYGYSKSSVFGENKLDELTQTWFSGSLNIGIKLRPLKRLTFEVYYRYKKNYFHKERKFVDNSGIFAGLSFIFYSK